MQRRHRKTSLHQRSFHSLSRLQERCAPNRDNNHARRGAVTLWIIAAGPAFLALLVFVLEIANIWLARVELENALGATALAAVKEWGDARGGDTLCPRDVGVAYAAANTLVGVPLSITNNYRLGPPNENDLCSGNLIFGSIITQEPPFVFDASETSGCGGRFLIEFDVSSQGSVGGGEDNQWGISVQPTQQVTDIRVTRVIYRLPDTFDGQNPVFDFSSFPAILSSNLADNLSGNKVRCNAKPNDIDCPGGPG
ncbi:MAG: Tad domain-containing protein, partial [Planctomycetes bacterium]|nr:Tad domain-containing protein [Planctomycetota bacterium]